MTSTLDLVFAAARRRGHCEILLLGSISAKEQSCLQSPLKAHLKQDCLFISYAARIALERREEIDW